MLKAESLRILVAEDHFAARQMVISVVRAKNVALVDSATDGRQTREMLERAYAVKQPYHIVFLDWQMPLIDGIHILKHFRALPQFASTAFVMVTSCSLQSQVLEAVKSGATSYMIKPISAAQLSRKFDEIFVWLKQHDKEKELA